jgi:hypothetical protein
MEQYIIMKISLALFWAQSLRRKLKTADYLGTRFLLEEQKARPRSELIIREYNGRTEDIVKPGRWRGWGKEDIRRTKSRIWEGDVGGCLRTAGRGARRRRRPYWRTRCVCPPRRPQPQFPLVHHEVGPRPVISDGCSNHQFGKNHRWASWLETLTPLIVTR